VANRRAARNSTRRGAANSLRIIGGKWRSRKIAFPDVAGLRPTPDRVRETLFNWLGAGVANARCLDLFAGSGALGIEALSRGAAQVVFVERDAQVVATLRESLAALQVRESARIAWEAAADFLQGGGSPFDVVFLDPPFESDLLEQAMLALDRGGWLRAGSLIYLECPRAAGEPRLPPGWERLKAKYAGQVGYHLARKLAGNAA
jgi:16S rRNA (guanine966-N2)-methyltransferase